MPLFHTTARHAGMAATQRPTVSAIHSGNMGDLVYAIPALRAVGATRLILNLCVDPGIGGRNFSQGAAEFLVPLLLAQTPIHEIEIQRAALNLVDGEGHRMADGLPLEGVDPADLGVDHNFDRFRLDPDLFHKHLIQTQADAVGAVIDPAAAFLELPPAAPMPPPGLPEAPILLSLTPRYRRLPVSFFWRLLRGLGPLVVIGMPSEARLYHGLDIPFHSAPDALSLARLIASARLLVGNPSLPYAIAEGLKTPRLMDLPEDRPNNLPLGANGWKLPADDGAARRMIMAICAGDPAAAGAAAASLPVRLPERRGTLFWRGAGEAFVESRSVSGHFPAQRMVQKLVLSLPAFATSPAGLAFRLSDYPGWYEVEEFGLFDRDDRALWRFHRQEGDAVLFRDRDGAEAPIVIPSSDGTSLYWRQFAGGGYLELSLPTLNPEQLGDAVRFEATFRPLPDGDALLAEAVDEWRRALAQAAQDEMAAAHRQSEHHVERRLAELDQQHRRQVARLEQDKIELQGEIAGLLRSTSWRLTAPLRGAIAILQTVRRRVAERLRRIGL